MTLREFISWIIAEDRPTSISELETNRIFSIYENLLGSVLPTAEEIGKSFNLPMRRSRYIIQNLNYRRPEFMKRRRIEAIRAAFERGEVSEDGLPVVIIPRECDEYLYSLATELALSHLITSTPSASSYLKAFELK